MLLGPPFRRFAFHLPAWAIGLTTAWWMLPWETVRGTGGLWAAPGRDLAQNLSGHLAAQHAPLLRFPPLVAPDLWWPGGLSAAMTDSNPALTLLAMAAAAVLGQPVNLFGAFLVLCVAAQAPAAAYAATGLLRLFGPASAVRRCAAATGAAALSVSFPFFLARFPHINLLAHFLLLLALGLVARMLARPERRWRDAVLLQIATILVHPYLFAFGAALLCAPLLARRTRRDAGGWIAAAAVPMALFAGLSGGLGGADHGFGFYSMNLLSPVWPQRSGLFGPELPVLDATGGQYEGFSYLGAGALLLLLAAPFAGGRVPWRRLAPLLAVLAALLLLALTPRVHAGHVLVVPLGTWPLDQVFGAVRASGRAAWPVAYGVVFLALGRLASGVRLPVLVPLLAVAAGLQWVDAGPWRESERAYFAAGEGQTVPIPVLPAGLALLRTAPACLAGPFVAVPDLVRLRAIQAGGAVADMRASRQPRAFNCESALSDALESPMRPGEVRVVLPPATAALRPEAIGGTCRAQGEAVVCARDTVPAGAALAAAAPIPEAGGAWQALLGTGWRAEGGRAWSEGPRAALLFRMAERRRMVLTLTGVGNRAGEAREVLLRVGHGDPRPVRLPDGVPVHVPLDAGPGIVFVAIDIFRPIDPARRGLAAPVNRAGVVLDGVAFE